MSTQPPTSPGRSTLLSLVGLCTIAVVGLPVVIAMVGRPALLSEPRYAGWLVSYSVLIAALVWGERRRRLDPTPARHLAPLLAQTIAALAINGLVPTVFGGVSLGGVLLVVVATQLAQSLPVRLAVTWIVVQSMLLAAVQHHLAQWPWSISLVAAGAFLGFQLFAAFAAHTARSESRARAALAMVNHQLRQTQQQLAQAAVNSERTRILRELHDITGHHLAALSLNLEAAANLTDGRGQELVRHCRGLTRLILADIRSVLSDEPGASDPSDLSAQLRALAAGLPGLTVHLDLPPATEAAPVPASHAHALLRAAQEFLTNSVRHGGASQIWISLARDATGLRLEARDDGRGADRIRPGAGLAGMRARIEDLGGALEITSRAGHGCRILATLPPVPVAEAAA